MCKEVMHIISKVEGISSVHTATKQVHIAAQPTGYLLLLLHEFVVVDSTMGMSRLACETALQLRPGSYI